MKKLFLTLLIPFLATPLCGSSAPSANGQADWQTRLAIYQKVMRAEAYELLARQYAMFAKGEAPTIANPAIKSIPIQESNEELADVHAMKNDRISMLPNPDHPFASPDNNSGFDASVKVRKTVFLKLLAMVSQLDHLAKEFGYEPGQVSIKVFEGLRDIKTQEMLFSNKAKEIHDANPSMTEEDVFNETSKWVSPVRNNTPVHSTGGAVDIRLWDTKLSKFLDMGPFGVIWGKNPTVPTFSDDLTDEQKNNRLFQAMAATQAGLTNYLYEYWHFSHGDRYASYWLEPDAAKRTAIYGSL